MTSDARLALEESSKYEQQLTENATQLRLVESLRNYVNNPKKMCIRDRVTRKVEAVIILWEPFRIWVCSP